MKTFKIKDLVITIEGERYTDNPAVKAITKISPQFFCKRNCSFQIASWCTNNNSGIPTERITTWCTPTCYGTNCGGTNWGDRFDTTIYELRDIEILEELKIAKEQILEMEKVLEANFKPQTKEDLDMLETKLNAAVKEVQVLKRQMK